MREIEYTRRSLRALMRLPRNRRDAIRAKIEQLADDPAQLENNITDLRNRPGFRLRVSDWRVIYEITDEALTILDIGPRGSVYED